MYIHIKRAKIIVWCLLIIQVACMPQRTAQVSSPEPTARQAEPTGTATPAPTDTLPAPTATELPATPTQAPVKVVIMMSKAFADAYPEVQTEEKSLQKRFNETHDRIQIEFNIAEGNNLTSDLTSVIQWKHPPDIILSTGIMAVDSIRGEWLDLSPYIAEEAYDMSRFSGPNLKMHGSEQGIVGFPFLDYPYVLFYNPVLFDQAQVPYPPQEFGAPYADGDPWNYDKLLEISKKIVVSANGPEALSPSQDPEKLNVFGFTREPNIRSWESLPYTPQFGDESSLGVSPDYKTAAFNTQMFKDALQWDKDAIWKWHIMPSVKRVCDAAGCEPFYATEMVAMVEYPSWYGYGPSVSSGYTHWNIAAVPAGPNGKILVPTDSDMVGILKATLHPEEAWEVLKWLYEPENLKPLIEAFIDVTMGAPEDTAMQKELPTLLAKSYPQVNAQVLIQAIQYADLVNHEAWIPKGPEIRKVMYDTYVLIETDKNVDIDQLLEKANADIQALLDEYWKNH